MSTDADHDSIEDDERDLSWATVLKRTFEAYLRGERPNMVSLLSHLCYDVKTNCVLLDIVWGTDILEC